jgi:hypothetical protein
LVDSSSIATLFRRTKESSALLPRVARTLHVGLHVLDIPFSHRRPNGGVKMNSEKGMVHHPAAE